MTISAGIGIANFPFASGKEFWSWVDLCDAGGVDSIWQSDRIISRDPALECMSTMAALAGGSKRLKFGMNVASLGLRDPVLTAKACATIDVLSDGRLLPAFGVGSGFSRDFVATGTPTKGRGQRTDEGLEIMSRLWSEERVTFAGKHYQLDEASICPLPVQQPMPLWVGGSAKQAIERTARWGTGWQAGIETAEQIQPVISAIKTAAKAHGRRIDDDHFGAGFGFRFGTEDEPVVQAQIEGLSKRLGKAPEGYIAVGDEELIMSRLLEFHAAGAHKFILRPIAHGAEDVFTQTKLMVEKVLPLVADLNQRTKAAMAAAKGAVTTT